MFEKDKREDEECMISLVICSRSKDISPVLKENISRTIGTSYKLIVIDNSLGKYSISQAYNRGLRQSTGSYICFLHNEILIRTVNWGIVLIDIFSKDNRIGLIGIAGTNYKTKMPSTWWVAGNLVMNIIQHQSNGEKEIWEKGFKNQQDIEVAAIDGVFMVMRADERIFFDEELKGFHNYDLFLSLIHQKYKKKIIVTGRILIEHFSIGKLDRSWYRSTSFLHKKYSELLPLLVVDDNFQKEKKELEFRNGTFFIKCLGSSLIQRLCIL